MKKVEKIWAQLGKQPKVRNTKLNDIEAMRDLSRQMDNAIQRGEEFYDSLTSVNYEYQVALENAQELFDTVKLDFFDDLIDKAYALSDKIDKISGELGIDPSDQFPQYDEMLEFVTDLERVIMNIEDEYSTSDFGSQGLTLR